MGLGLVTDGRAREEGAHYTYQCAARLHGCGAADETRGLQDHRIAAFDSLGARFFLRPRKLSKAAILAF